MILLTPHPVRVIALLCIACLVALPAYAQQHSENFSTIIYKDAVNTSADWNTAAGTLTLPSYPLSVIGSYDTSGFAQGLTLAGKYAYVGDGSSGVHIFDISDPANPVLTSTYTSPNGARAIALSGQYMLVCQDQGGLNIADVHDPANPTEVTNLPLQGFVNDVEVCGDFAFCAVSGLGMYIVDISDPATPVVVASVAALAGAHDIEISGVYAYIADSGATSPGIHTYDISDPASPVFTGHSITGKGMYSVSIDGDFLYSAGDDQGLLIFDIADPANVSLLASDTTPQQAFATTVAGPFVYVSDRSGAVYAFDVRERRNPSLLNSTTTDAAHGLAVAGRHLYVADGNSGLKVMRVAGTVDPVLVASIDKPSMSQRTAVAGGYAYLPSGSSGTHVFDISNPHNPTQVATIPSTGPNTLSRSVKIEGNHAYIADYTGGLKAVDISDPTQPKTLSTLLMYNFTNDMEICGDYAYVAVCPGGFFVVDVSDPSNMTVVSQYEPAAYAYDVALYGDYAFVADNGFTTKGVYALDISDPTNVTQVSYAETPGVVFSVDLDGNYLYVAEYVSGISIYDVSDPANLQRLGSYDTPGEAQDIAGRDGIIYVADRSSRQVLMLDASDPMNPTLINSIATNHQPHGVILYGDYAFIGDGTAGLGIAQISQRRFHVAANRAQSTTLSSLAEPVRRVRVQALQSGVVDWEISNDAGSSWQSVPGDNTWQKLSATGTEVQWRAAIAAPDELTAAVVDRVDVEWLYDAAVITSLEDVADDHGGWLRLQFTRSHFDFTDEVATPIMSYDVHRRSADNTRWDVVATITAQQSDNYTVAVATESDGRSHTYYVSARSSSLVFDSQPRSGTSLDNLLGDVPVTSLQLYQNAPNPFNPTTLIVYDVPDASARVTISVFDVAGRLVRTLIDEEVGGGRRDVTWDGTDALGRRVASGTYFYRLQSGGDTVTRKMSILK